VSELVTNAVRHGSHSTAQSVALEMSAESFGITGSVSDEGCARFTLTDDVADPFNVDGAELLDEHAGSLAGNVDFGAKGSRPGAAGCGSHDHD
jgi:anti-sigma regulatory factor (Ser/Thr protein kinase)